MIPEVDAINKIEISELSKTLIRTGFCGPCDLNIFDEVECC